MARLLTSERPALSEITPGIFFRFWASVMICRR